AKFNRDTDWYNGLSPPFSESTRGRLIFSRCPAATGPKGAYMQIVYQRCCGMDAHKNNVTAYLLLIDDGGEYHAEKRVFGTMTRDLREMGEWLHAQSVQRIAMEATIHLWALEFSVAIVGGTRR